MMGIDDLSADLIQMQYSVLMSSKGGFTFGVFKEMIKDLAMQFKRQEGKYYVLLSLEEAEHFRGVLHARKNFSLVRSESPEEPSITTAALWMMGDFEMTLLGSSTKFKRAHLSQHSAMVNCFRFVNSDTHFDNNSLTVLLRVLESNSCEQREKWWTEIRACRRRRQIALDGSFPVLTVFNTQNEFEFMEFKAIIMRVQTALKEHGMLIFDAFRAFNSSNSGLLSCSELYGGLDFLGIPFTPSQIYDLVRKIAILNEGLVCYEDFKRVFGTTEDELESHGGATFEPIAPKNIPELVDQLKPEEKEEVVSITDVHFQDYKVKVSFVLIILIHWSDGCCV